jgi:tetratricopeptide (TPR) repeat protein
MHRDSGCTIQSEAIAMRNQQRIETPREAIARADSAAQQEKWREALEAYGAGIGLTEGSPDGATARADALRGAAIVRVRLGEWHGAARDIAESRRVAERLHDELRLALAENVRGAIEFERGDWDEATRRYAVARRHAAAVEDVPLLMEVENNEGVLWAARGNRARAEEHFRRALLRFEELELHPCGARVLNNLGMVLAEEDRFDEAEDAYQRSLAECKRRGDMLLAATVMINRGRLALSKDEPIRAHTLATTAQQFAERLENGPLAADAACLLAAVARSQRRWDEAEEYLAVALERSGGGKAPLAEADVWVEGGRLCQDLGRVDEALAAFRRARDCFAGLGAVAEVDRLERQIAELEDRALVAV